jgi:hypothetical protein
MLPDAPRARSLIRHLLAAYATKMRAAATDPSLQQSDRDYLHDEARLAQHDGWGGGGMTPEQLR